jgi:hypothetical protein
VRQTFARYRGGGKIAQSSFEEMVDRFPWIFYTTSKQLNCYFFPNSQSSIENRQLVDKPQIEMKPQQHLI